MKGFIVQMCRKPQKTAAKFDEALVSLVPPYTRPHINLLKHHLNHHGKTIVMINTTVLSKVAAKTK